MDVSGELLDDSARRTGPVKSNPDVWSIENRASIDQDIAKIGLY